MRNSTIRTTADCTLRYGAVWGLIQSASSSGRTSPPLFEINETGRRHYYASVKWRRKGGGTFVCRSKGFCDGVKEDLDGQARGRIAGNGNHKNGLEQCGEGRNTRETGGYVHHSSMHMDTLYRVICHAPTAGIGIGQQHEGTRQRARQGMGK